MSINRNNLRVIARLDTKGLDLIKGVRLEGLRKLGSPEEFALRYYSQGIDEILFIDAVASLYRRKQLLEIVSRAARLVFVPITVGGGVRTTSDFEALLRSGADKVAINTGAIKNPNILSELAGQFGRQSVVLSIEAKKVAPGKWQAMTDYGREPSGRDVIEWAEEATFLGAGEVLVTSIDRDGTRSGFDTELIKEICDRVNTPVIASGGMGSIENFLELAKTTDVSGIAIADALHFNRLCVQDIKSAALANNISMRTNYV
jgi:cyclase